MTPDRKDKGNSPLLIAGLTIGGCITLATIVAITILVVVIVLTLLGPNIGNNFPNTVPSI